MPVLGPRPNMRTGKSPATSRDERLLVAQCCPLNALGLANLLCPAHATSCESLSGTPRQPAGGRWRGNITMDQSSSCSMSARSRAFRKAGFDH